MRIYISGPMTGKACYNVEAFDAAAKRLTAQRHFVINPHDFTPLLGTANEVAESFAEHYRMLDLDKDYLIHSPSACILERTRIARAMMDVDLAAVRSCDAIYLLKGWEDSRGAKKELVEALTHGLTVMQEGAEA